jgi:hypothetical protein
MKTIGASALSLSLLAGTLLGPVSTAFAKPLYERDEGTVTRHTFRILVFKGSFRQGGFFKSYHLSNRSISSH